MLHSVHVVQFCLDSWRAWHAVLRGKLLSTRYSRQLLTTEDGGTIGLDWFRGCDAPGVLPAGAPVLLVLHGLTGMPPLHMVQRKCCAKPPGGTPCQQAHLCHIAPKPYVSHRRPFSLCRMLWW